MNVETKVDLLESRLCQKIEVLTGYGAMEVKIRKLEQVFRFYDKTNSGYLDFEGFFSALTGLNFVGVQRDMESLFNRFDENGTGYIDYKELSCQVFGLGVHPTFDSQSREVLSDLKSSIMSRHGASGILTFEQTLRSSPLLSSYDNKDDGQYSSTKIISRSQLENILSDYYINVSSESTQTFVNCLDPDLGGEINLLELIRALKTGMSYDRKKIIASIYNQFRDSPKGYVNKTILSNKFNASVHPDVIEKRMTLDQAKYQFIDYFGNSNSNSITTDNKNIISWSEFLGYFKALNTYYDDDNVFEYMARHLFSASTGKIRRVLVTHSDGTQEVAELDDDFVNKANMNDMVDKLMDQGMRDIIKVDV